MAINTHVKAESFEIYESIFSQLLKKREEAIIEKTQKEIEYFLNYITAIQEIYITEKGQKTKIGRFVNMLQDYISKYHLLHDSLDKPFMLFIVGTGKYGKSTLINTLLEQQMADVGVLPKTWKIDVFRGDLNPTIAILKFRNLEERTVTSSEARAFIQLEEDKRTFSEKEIQKKLKQLKREVTSFEAFKELRLKLEREELYQSELVEVHWGTKQNKILKNFYIVDTPGLTQNIMGEIRNNVQDYYHKADGVLWMLDATSIAASNAKNLIDDLESNLKSVGGTKHQNMIGVLNRIDLINSNKGVEGVNQVINDAKGIYGSYFKTIIPFSALNAFRSVEENNQLLKRSSGLQNLQEEIQSTFLNKAKIIQAEKKKQSLRTYNSRVVVLIEQFCLEFLNDLTLLDTKVDEAVYQIKKELVSYYFHFIKEYDQYEKKATSDMGRKVEILVNIENDSRRTDYLENEILLKSNFEHISSEKEKNGIQLTEQQISYYSKQLSFTEYPNLDKLYKQNENSSNSNSTAVLDDIKRDSIEAMSSINFNAIYNGFFDEIFGSIGKFFAKWGAKSKLRGSLPMEISQTVIKAKQNLRSSNEYYFHKMMDAITNVAITTFTDKNGGSQFVLFNNEGIEIIEGDLSINVQDFPILEAPNNMVENLEMVEGLENKELIVAEKQLNLEEGMFHYEKTKKLVAIFENRLDTVNSLLEKIKQEVPDFDATIESMILKGQE